MTTWTYIRVSKEVAQVLNALVDDKKETYDETLRKILGLKVGENNDNNKS